MILEGKIAIFYKIAVVFVPYPRTIGGKRRSGRKPGARGSGRQLSGGGRLIFIYSYSQSVKRIDFKRI